LIDTNSILKQLLCFLDDIGRAEVSLGTRFHPKHFLGGPKQPWDIDW